MLISVSESNVLCHGVRQVFLCIDHFLLFHKEFLVGAVFGCGEVVEGGSDFFAEDVGGAVGVVEHVALQMLILTFTPAINRPQIFGLLIEHSFGP